MGTRRAYLHVGLDDGSGSVVADALGAHAHALLDLKVRRAGDPSATFRGALDVLGAHGDWGYERDDVDGAWTRLVEAARPGRDTILVSEALLARADDARARRVVDSFDGFDVHAVVTVRAPDPWVAHDLTEVLPRWAEAVGAAERVHVLLGDPEATWRSLGRVAGFGTTSLRVRGRTGPIHPVDAARAAAWRETLTGSSYDVVGDVALLDGAPASDLGVATTLELARARHEAARLRHHNADLQARLEKVERKRRKLKRRLSALT